MPIFAQDIIHKLEVGGGHRVLRIGVGIVALVALALFYNMAAFQNFATPEAMDGAQLARNISEGKGFTTDFVRPLSLHLLRKHERNSAANSSSVAELRRVDGAAVLPTERWPDISNGPAYPLVLAGVLKVTGVAADATGGTRSDTYTPELWIAGFNQLLLVVCACLVFSLARRLFDEPVAWVSAAVFAGAELFWRHSVSGLPTLWLTFLMLLLAQVLVRMDFIARPSVWGTTTGGAMGTARPALMGSRRWLPWLAIAAGVITATAGLTRYGFLAFIIPVVGYIVTLPTRNTGSTELAPPLGQSGAIGTSRPTSPAVLGLLASVAFVALVGSWVARNLSVSGTPFGTALYAALAHTANFPEDTLMRSLSPSFETMTTGAIGRKVLLNLRELWLQGLPTLGGSWVTALFLAGLVVPFRNVITRRLRLLVVAFLGITALAQAIVSPAESPTRHLSSEYVTVIAPLVFVLGVSLLFTLLDQFTAVAVRYGILAVFFVAACAPLLLTFAAPRHSPLAYPPYYPPAVQAKAAYVAEDGWMVSDMPWAVAWYGNRTAAWLPLRHGMPEGNLGEDFYSLHRVKPISALHLSNLTLSKLDTAAVAQWRQSEGTDRDWEAFRQQLKTVADAAGSGGSRSEAVTNARVEVYSLVNKHWVRGSGVDWESFLMGILVNREVPTGFPLRVAPLGIMPEIFLTDSERPATKTIKLSEQADRR